MAEIKITSESTITPPQNSEMIGLRRDDWVRLKVRVSQIKSPTPIYQILAGALIGVFTSAIFALIGFHATSDQKLNPATEPVTIAIGIASLLGALLCFSFDKSHQQVCQTTVEMVTTEIEMIEDYYRPAAP